MIKFANLCLFLLFNVIGFFIIMYIMTLIAENMNRKKKSNLILLYIFNFLIGVGFGCLNYLLFKKIDTLF